MSKGIKLLGHMESLLTRITAVLGLGAEATQGNEKVAFFLWLEK
jgi:hypothetical protein